jgi:hypothetical protein
VPGVVEQTGLTEFAGVAAAARARLKRHVRKWLGSHLVFAPIAAVILAELPQLSEQADARTQQAQALKLSP